MLTLIRDRLTTVLAARQVAAAVVGLLTVAPVFGQERRAEVSATYMGLNLPPIVQPENVAKTRFSYQYPDRKKWLDAAGPAAIATPNNTPVPGILAWEVPPTEFGTAGMERNFRTYCAEAPVGVVSGATYRYAVRSPAVPDAFHLPDTEAGNAESFRRATYIRELFGRYYIPSLTEARAARAFQIALWEIIHESNWVEDKAPPLDLSAGSFTAIAEQDDADSVGLSRDYLKSLTGNDNVYYENPDLAGRELVWMQGLPSLLANNVVPQSQFALQFVRGGVNSAGPAPLGVTGFPGGIGAVGGGVAPFGGGGFGGIGGGGGSPGGTTGTTSTPGTTPPATVTTPPTTPPTTTTSISSSPPTLPPSTVIPVNDTPSDTTPPGGGVITPFTFPPDTTTNPVPAPAGLVLGLIAVGALAGRRVFARGAAGK